MPSYEFRVASSERLLPLAFAVYFRLFRARELARGFFPLVFGLRRLFVCLASIVWYLVAILINLGKLRPSASHLSNKHSGLLDCGPVCDYLPVYVSPVASSVYRLPSIAYLNKSGQSQASSPLLTGRILSRLDCAPRCLEWRMVNGDR